MRSKSIISAFALVVTLGGCGGGALNTTNSVADTLQSSQGQAFVKALGVGGNLIPGMSTVLNDVNNGVASADTTALPMLCAALPWADAAFDMFGPLAPNGAVSAQDVKDADTAAAAFENGPCKTPPTDLASAVASGASLWQTLANDLGKSGVAVGTGTTQPAS